MNLLLTGDESVFVYIRNILWISKIVDIIKLKQDGFDFCYKNIDCKPNDNITNLRVHVDLGQNQALEGLQ